MHLERPTISQGDAGAGSAAADPKSVVCGIIPHCLLLADAAIRPKENRADGIGDSRSWCRAPGFAAQLPHLQVDPQSP